MKNLVLRSLSGLIYVGLIVGSLLINEYAFWGLCILFILLGTIEFSKLTNQETKPLVIVLDVLLALSLIPTIISTTLISSESLMLTPAILMILRFVAQLYMPNDKNPLNTLAYSILGLLYVAGPIWLMAVLYYEESPAVILAMFIMIWLNDTGAYVVGSLLGRKLIPYKMFPRISPKKSWAGFVGGLLFTVASSFVFINIFGEYYQGIDIIEMIGFAVVVVVFATWGDLIESLMKRTIGVKDSGNLIPGHGGILDRIDSLLFVLPAILCYCLIVL